MEPGRPNRAVYWNDGRVVLYEGPLSAKYRNLVVPCQGAVVFDWQPRPRVTWHGVTSASNGAVAVFDNWQSPESLEPAIELPFAMPLPTRRRGAFRLREATGTVSATGVCDGIDFHLPRPNRCDTVTFNLINGPDLLPLGPLRQRGRVWSGRWQLDDAEWAITVDARADISNRIKDLKRTRGYAFTHVGTMQRIDRSGFVRSAARDVLDDLFLFLTFVRGATVGVALPVGTLDRQVTWRQWSSGLSSPYSGFSWADPHTPGDLAALWPTFRAARQDSRWSNALLRAVRHYAEANQAMSTEVTLTLAQAALELLGTAVCVERDSVVAPDKWESAKAAWRIRRLLRSRVPLGVPSTYKALTVAAKAHGWSDGPAAVTALRNTVTHWTTGKPAVDAKVWTEASQLSVYYLEMALLSALGYRARALDRTARPILTGGSTTVPWALSDDAARQSTPPNHGPH